MVAGRMSALLGLLALAGSAQAANEPSPVPPVVILGDFTFGRQPDGNSVVFVDEAGLVVFDTGRHPEHQGRILRVAQLQRKPIVAIVNSHWHLDHSGGNAELRGFFPDAKLYTSQAVNGALAGFLARGLAGGKARLADPALSPEQRAEAKLDVDAVEQRKDLLPDVVVKGKRKIAEVKRRIELHLAPRAATGGDVWAYDSASATLAAGDLVVLPAPFFDTACPQGWRAALDELARQPFQTLFPGHGAPMTRAEFDRYRLAFGRLIDCAESASAVQLCVEGWIADAWQLLPAEKDREAARQLLDYYFTTVLRSPAKKKEFCDA